MSKRNPNKIIKSRKTSVEGNFSCVPNLTEQSNTKNNSWLYRFVYSSRISATVVFFLLISFSLQSAERVYASTDAEVAVDTSNVEVLEEVQTPVTETAVSEVLNDNAEILPIEVTEDNLESVINNTDSLVPNQINSEQVASENTILNGDDFNISSTTQPSTTIEDSINLETPSEVIDSQENDLINNDLNLDESVDTSSINVANNITEADLLNEQFIASSTEETILDPEYEVATETIEALLTTNESVSVTQSDSEFSFSKNECTQLATGSFYCRQPQQNQLKDALFSAPDQDGDLEIFLIRDGIQVQVTNNQMDDAAPYFDLNTNTIVWHRLINDRYQIVSYDVENNLEKQITNTAENNMEPTRQGEYTVWQRWVDGGWNIILLDGDKETQITKNIKSNIAPYIHGSLVVWNSKDQTGEKTIEMFDIVSRTYVTVDDPDGMSVSNPRMVFVYDSLHPNGDIITKGYDVLAKKFIDLDSLPRELPEELPAADSTGETRALIQIKPAVKSEAEESINSSSTPNILPPVPLDVSTSTMEMTLDLSQATTSTDSISISSDINDDLSLVIGPLILQEASSTEGVQE